jgi:hypothetical protein
MKKYSNFVLNVVLAFGLVLVLCGLVLLAIFSVTPQRHGFLMWPTLMLVAGIFLIYVSLAITRFAHQLFMGLNFCFAGILLLVFQRGNLVFSIHQVWPLCAVFCGCTLVLSGYFRYHYFRTVYLFPAALLTAMGLFFSLFSFHIIRMPLHDFVAMSWPVVLIVFGAILVGLFLYQQKAAFPYMTDDSVDDEECIDDILEEEHGDNK